MVKPKDPYKITLQDLVNSGQGDTVSSILIDLNGFWTYENREVLVANDTDSNTADLDDTWHHILLPNEVVLLDQLSYSERVETSAKRNTQNSSFVYWTVY